MKITTENCKLLDYTSRDSVHGTPPIPVYKIVISIEEIEFVSIEKFNYVNAEKIRDKLVENE